MQRAVCVFLVVMSLAVLAQAAYLDPRTDYAQDRFIVKLYPNVGDLDPVLNGATVKVFDPALTSLNTKWGVVRVERLFMCPQGDKIAEQLDLPGYWRFWVDKPADASLMEAILADYSTAPLVEHVEPVGIHRVTYAPNDPSWSNQWYLRTTTGDHDIDAPEAWDVERGDTTAILGICDTGVLYNHPDLQSHIWHNWAEVNGTPGVDNDGNGFVDDTVGYDFVSSAEYGYSCWSGEDCSGADADPKDFNGHGTHVAGIAAAVTNNSVGVCGIAGGGGAYRGARIMPLRIGWSASYWGMEMGFVGMDYAAQAFNYGRIKGCCAFNCSWGNDNSGGLGAATDAAVLAGVVVCVAAGNDGSSTADYLCGRTDCIAVAATDNGDILASFSNYGSWVDVSAPGVSIYSTYSNHYTASYEYLDGTSMATPCVVGEAGLLKSHVPSWTRTQITPAIVNNVDNINALNPGYSGLLGSGRINLNLALAASASITVTSPNGGEAWYTGESHNITWTSNGFTGNIKIELNRTYPGGTWETIIASTANTGTYPWAVSGAVTSTARVRVSSVSTPAILDISNAEFTIATPYITVTSPNGGDLWYIGQSQTISWNSGGFTGNVKIELNRSYSGGAWEVLYASVANDGSELWTATGTANTSAARIRVSSVGVPSITDVSDANFTLSLPTITVNVPNGAESWTIGVVNTITWGSVAVSGNVMIEINRSYPTGVWETLFATTPNDTFEQWLPTGPATTQARIRISAVGNSLINDVSDASFTIVGQPPVIRHDALDDFAPGTGTIVARANSSSGGIGSVTMYYRLAGGSTFTALSMPLVTAPDLYAASLASLPAGSYEYYVEAADIVALTARVPANAPASLYTFTISPLCTATLSYDDGTAEWFNYPGADSVDIEWAVKFGPVPTPFALYGARFAASRILPDSVHTPVQVKIYLADGPSGMPGTLAASYVKGSIGNEIAGLPAGTNWAQAIFRDALGNPLQINSPQFYVSVSNMQPLNIEAFGRDTGGANNHHSYFYDPCRSQWFSEDSTIADTLAHPGNRLIRVQGYGLVPPTVVINRVGPDVKLFWTNLGAPAYKVYNCANSGGPYTFLQSTPDTFLTVSPADSNAVIRMYFQVQSATQ